MSQDVSTKLSQIAESQARIETHQDNTRQLLEKHASLLERHNETLLRLTITVERHESRSDKLEIRQNNIDKAVQVIKDHVTKLQGAGYLIKSVGAVAGVATAVGGFLWGVYQLLQKLGL